MKWEGRPPSPRKGTGSWSSAACPAPSQECQQGATAPHLDTHSPGHCPDVS